MFFDVYLFELSMIINVYYWNFYKFIIVFICLIKLFILMKRMLENFDKIIECWLLFLLY